MSSRNDSLDLLCYRMRSERQKKRLKKKAADQYLLRLDRQKNILWKQKRQLPMVPVTEPYQKGWKRTFILSKEVEQSGKAAFYQALLDKINTVQYSSNKTFTQKYRRRGKKVHKSIPQSLQQLDEWQWRRLAQNLTEEEKRLFQPTGLWSVHYSRIVFTYIFTEPWRFTLQTTPHIISELKMVDSALEQEYAALDSLITFDGENRIIKLRYGAWEGGKKDNDNERYYQKKHQVFINKKIPRSQWTTLWEEEKSYQFSESLH